MSTELPKPRWRNRLILASMGPVLAFIALEVFARAKLGNQFVFGAYVGSPQAILGEFDPDLGWRNRANASARIALADATYLVTLNTHGQRGPARGRAKPAGVKRIVVLGDSTSWGWGVDDDATWTSLVEAQLGPSVEIINLAVPGYGTDQELWVLESVGLAYEPDLVLLGFVHNDTLYNEKTDMQGMSKPMFVRAADGSWSITNRPVPYPPAGSELAQKRIRRRASMYLASVRLMEPPPPQATRYDLANPKVIAGIEGYWNTVVEPTSPTHHALSSLAKTCASANVPLAVFHFPHLVDRWLYDPTTPLPSNTSERPYQTYGTRILAAASAELGFHTFSIDQALLDVVSNGVNLDCGDQHLNARGNQIVADVVAARVRELLQLP